MFRRKRKDDQTGEIATELAALTGGGWLTAAASGLALIFSAVSLYQTVLKRPELHAYVPATMHYTRDSAGDNEVFAIPLTIANNGARDGTVLEVTLAVSAPDAKKPKYFTSTYFVSGDYFTGGDVFNMQTRSFDKRPRPKVPFAPISVAGRSAYSGTILFYTTSPAFPKIAHQKGDYRLTIWLKTRNDDSLGMLDRLWQSEPEPISFTVRLGYFDELRLKRGNTSPLRRVDFTEVGAQKASADPKPATPAPQSGPAPQSAPAAQ